MQCWKCPRRNKLYGLIKCKNFSAFGTKPIFWFPYRRFIFSSEGFLSSISSALIQGTNTTSSLTSQQLDVMASDGFPGESPERSGAARRVCQVIGAACGAAKQVSSSSCSRDTREDLTPCWKSGALLGRWCIRHVMFLTLQQDRCAATALSYLAVLLADRRIFLKQLERRRKMNGTDFLFLKTLIFFVFLSWNLLAAAGLQALGTNSLNPLPNNLNDS